MKPPRHKISGALRLLWLLLPIVVLLFMAATASSFTGESGLLTGYRLNESDVKAGIFAPPLSPGSKGIHWLGTNGIAADVFTQWYLAARVSFFVGLGSATLSLILGIGMGLLGSSGQYFLLRPAAARALLAGSLLFTFWLSAVLPGVLHIYGAGIAVLLILLAAASVLLVALLLNARAGQRRPLTWPATAVNSLSAFLDASPRLLLLILLADFWLRPGVGAVVISLGILGWVGLARMIRLRAGTLSSIEFVESARVLGLSTGRIIIRHIVPQLYPLMLTHFAFAAAGGIVAESALSFLNVGLPVGTASWGAMLNQAREMPSAWWLWLPPAIMIMWLAASLFSLGKHQEVQASGRAA